jgi:hypothetical protein
VSATGKKEFCAVFFSPLPADASLAMRLAAYVLRVMGAVGDRTRRVPAHDVARGIVPQAIYDRIAAWLQTRRIAIAGVMARQQAGKVYRPRAYAPRGGAEGVARAVRPAPAADAHLFRGFGWLYRWAPEVRVGAGHLVELLDDAEMKAAVLAAPGPMARAWAPLLNALGRRRPDWFPVLPRRVRERRRWISGAHGEPSDRKSLELGKPSWLIPGSSPGLTRSSRPPREAGGVAGDRRLKPGDDGCRIATNCADSVIPSSASAPTPAPPNPAPLPPMAAWTGRGPGPCRTLAEYRSPFEPPLWEVRVSKTS